MNGRHSTNIKCCIRVGVLVYFNGLVGNWVLNWDLQASLCLVEAVCNDFSCKCLFKLLFGHLRHNVNTNSFLVTSNCIFNNIFSMSFDKFTVHLADHLNNWFDILEEAFIG